MWVNKGAIHRFKINILYHQSISQMHFFSILRFKIPQGSPLILPLPPHHGGCEPIHAF